MKKTGLIGATLGHSLSPLIHERFYSVTGISGSYRLFETQKDQLGALLDRLESEGYDGVNVTIPYKKDVMCYLDGISEEAAAIGSVNTISFTDGKRRGYNTDYFGLKTLLETNGIILLKKRVAILGAGGAARCAWRLAHDEGAAEVVVVSRHPAQADKDLGAIGYDALDRFESIDVLINTTPVGMSPDTGHCPAKSDIVQKSSSIVDIIYNPPETLLLQEAKKFGKVYANGLLMLSAQGIKAQEIWNNESYGSDVYRDVFEHLRRTFEMPKTNIVLIGMPGSGKTSIGKRLAKKLGMHFIDTDALIESKHGPIPDIFREQGEPRFREYEHEAARQAASLTRTVISTGGGIILDARNMQTLGQTGVIAFLDRPLDLLLKNTDTSHRPLLTNGDEALIQLYNKRYALYKKYADIIPDNTSDIAACLTDTIKKLEELK